MKFSHKNVWLAITHLACHVYAIFKDTGDLTK
jgi:hypothetical protein